MPYFQRPSTAVAPIPSDSGGNSSPAQIVERAAAILEAETSASLVPGLGFDRSRPMGLPSWGGTGVDTRSLAELLAAILAWLERSSGGLSGSLPTTPAVPGSTPDVVPIVGGVAVKAGDVALVFLPLSNDGKTPVSVILNCTDLISNGGAVISAATVRFSPRTMSLAPAGAGSVTLDVSVPSQSPPGTYSGLVQAIGLNRPSAVVVVRVE
jgi:hypothetical protein